MFEFTSSERRVIIIITAVLLGSAGWQYVRTSTVEQQSFDYHKSDSVFTRRSHQSHLVQTNSQNKNHTGTESYLQGTEVKDTAAPQFHLNINTASAEELKQLPRIGPSIAKRIISYREKNGPFHSVDELKKVKGVGPKTLVRIKPYLRALD
jgi:comEA protein